MAVKAGSDTDATPNTDGLQQGTSEESFREEAGQAPAAAARPAARTPAVSERGPLWPYQTLTGAEPDDLPAHEPFDPREYLYERYAHGRRRSPALRLYYALRPLVPRRLQLALRRTYAPLQRLAKFPAWPIEPVLVDAQYERFRRRLHRREGRPIPFVNFWPNGQRFCFVLTHDVESVKGLHVIPRLLEIEQRHGFVSSWNFCAEQYPIPTGLFDEIRSTGCEIGLHGILHDGKLFSSRATFEANLPKIHRYIGDWQVDGFRSPATHRRADWMPELGCMYDSSFPDTDPFEPIAGGCCSIFPFFIDGMVELPITLVQDHTLFEILGSRSISPWILKSEWIIHHNGLINLIVHPDYMLSEERLDHYERFLSFLSAQRGGWHALPREVAQWWRTRSALDTESVARANGPVGSAMPQATIAHAREESGKVSFDVARSPRRGGRFATDDRAVQPDTRDEPRTSRRG